MLKAQNETLHLLKKWSISNRISQILKGATQEIFRVEGALCHAPPFLTAVVVHAILHFFQISRYVTGERHAAICIGFLSLKTLYFISPNMVNN